MKSPRRVMTASKRITDNKTEKYHRNIDKRGKVPKTTARNKSPFTVGPVMLGFFLFVVVGSALLQIIRTASVRFRPSFSYGGRR